MYLWGGDSRPFYPFFLNLLRILFWQPAPPRAGAQSTRLGEINIFFLLFMLFLIFLVTNSLLHRFTAHRAETASPLFALSKRPILDFSVNGIYSKYCVGYFIVFFLSLSLCLINADVLFFLKLRRTGCMLIPRHTCCSHPFS